ILRIITSSVLSLPVLALAPIVSRNLLATDDVTASFWAAILSVGILFWAFFPYVLQAYRRVTASIAVDLSLGIARILIVLVFVLVGGLTLGKALGSFVLSTIPAAIVGFWFVGTSFMRVEVPRSVYSKLLKFSGWVGVNRVISAVSGRLDIQMLAAMAGATATGFYSISSKLALFIVVLTSSFSAVLAPRLAAFDDRKKEKSYILKATAALVPLVIGIFFWVVIARPFILILFGAKYLPAVPVFRALAIAMVPFLLTAPPVTAIIYAMKKPVYIGIFALFQLVAIFLLNLVLIPKFGPYGPTITFGIVNTILAIYTWAIVIRHYWLSDQNSKTKILNSK
ncbi:MAG: oligosaccharide flippase family protein, partial [Patescibacteria group bacterium]